MSYYEPRHEPFYDYRLMVLWVLSSQDRNTHYEARSDALYNSVIITSLEKNLGWTKVFIFNLRTVSISSFDFAISTTNQLDIVSLFNKSYKTSVNKRKESSLTSAN